MPTKTKVRAASGGSFRLIPVHDAKAECRFTVMEPAYAVRARPRKRRVSQIPSEGLRCRPLNRLGKPRVERLAHGPRGSGGGSMHPGRHPQGYLPRVGPVGFAPSFRADGEQRHQVVSVVSSVTVNPSSFDGGVGVGSDPQATVNAASARSAATACLISQPRAVLSKLWFFGGPPHTASGSLNYRRRDLQPAPPEPVFRRHRLSTAADRCST